MTNIKLPLFIIFCFLFCNIQIFAQTIISTSGNDFRNNNLQISWTLGEPVIETFSNGNTQLTQGFHQTSLVVTAIDEIPELNASISVYPNPVADFLNLEIKNAAGMKICFTLYSMDGKVISTKQMDSDVAEIPMFGFAPSTYFLRVSNKTQNLKTFKIVKK